MIKKNLFFAIFMISTFVFAGGFRISLQGVRQAAMGHTSAHTKDASVMFFNPAGISFIPEKFSIAAGGFGVATEATYQNKNTLYSAKTNNPIGTPIYLAVSYDVLKDVTVGLSVTSPFGNTVSWGKDWAGSDLVQEIELKAFNFQPTVSYKFTDWFSVGAGYVYSRGIIKLSKSISALPNVNGAQSGIELSSSNASGSGYNLGMYFKPTSKLDVSVAYRSVVNIKVTDGEAKFNVPSSLTGPGQRFPVTDDTFSAKLPLASEFTLGMSYKITPKLLIAADMNIAGWQAYKSLDIDFGQAQAGNDPFDSTISRTKKAFHSTVLYRVGTEYMFTDKFAGRLGYYFDQSPVNDSNWSPETPSTDNHTITGGIGYSINKAFNVDLSGGYIMGQVRDVNNATAGFFGEAKSHGIFFGLGISYNR